MQSAVGDHLLKQTDESKYSVDFSLKDLGFGVFDDFYRYSGSLTTPPCNEVVQWTVVKDTMKISRRTMEKMVSFSKVLFKVMLISITNVQNKLGETIVDNYREIQPLNGRKITLYSKNHKACRWLYC